MCDTCGTCEHLPEAAAAAHAPAGALKFDTLSGAHASLNTAASDTLMEKGDPAKPLDVRRRVAPWAPRYPIVLQLRKRTVLQR
jgi:hypothetical protein